MLRHLAFIPAVFVFAVSCSNEVPSLPTAGVMSDSVGVSVWSVPGDDVPAPFTLERVGGLAMPDTGWAVWPDGVAVDTEQRTIYVLDESTPRVLVFDLDGGFLRQVGRKGQGPGEYDAPTALQVAPTGELLVMDPGAGFIHRWSPAGEYMDRDPISVSYWGPGFHAMAAGMVYTTAGGVESGVMREALVSVGVDGVDTLSVLESAWKPIEMPCGRVPVPEVFSWSAVWGAHSDWVAFMRVPDYEIVLRHASEPVAVFRRDVPPREIGPAEAEASVAVGPLEFLVTGCGMTSAGVVREAGFVPRVSSVIHLAVDPAGRVWAARGEAPVVESIDIFDLQSGFVGSAATMGVPAAFVTESRYVAIVDGEWGPVLEFWEVTPGTEETGGEG